MALLLLLIVVGLVWMLAAPGERFLPAFARLLTEPAAQRTPASFFTGLSYGRGRFQGRDVAVRLQLKRSRYGQGYFLISVAVGGAADLTGGEIETRTSQPAGRRALTLLAARDLRLSVEGGRLKALWKPQGFVIFPGRFVEDDWRRALEALHAVAASLEAAPHGAVTPEGAVEP